MKTSSNILEVRNLAFSWNIKSNFLLKINEFNLKRKKKILLLGESGTGKSTFLNIVSGILKPQKGSIKINDKYITSLNSKSKDHFRAETLGVIFQQFNILEFISPINNILLPHYFSNKKNKISAYHKAKSLAEKLGISEKMLHQKNSKELSVGQKQRIAIIRALINSPKIILADEPTSALDYKNKERFLSLLFDLCEKSGTSILMVSHDKSIASKFDEALFINNLNKKL